MKSSMRKSAGAGVQLAKGMPFQRGLAKLGIALLAGLCKTASGTSSSSVAVVSAPIPEGSSRMWMSVGAHRFSITLADTDAARAFAARLPLSIDMADLNANEKHGELSRRLPSNASRPGVIHAGDVMLYGSKTLVVFYSTFDSIYSYTILGRVDESTDLVTALGTGSARYRFSKD